MPRSMSCENGINAGRIMMPARYSTGMLSAANDIYNGAVTKVLVQLVAGGLVVITD